MEVILPLHLCIFFLPRVWTNLFAAGVWSAATRRRFSLTRLVEARLSNQDYKQKEQRQVAAKKSGDESPHSKGSSSPVSFSIEFNLSKLESSYTDIASPNFLSY